MYPRTAVLVLFCLPFFFFHSLLFGDHLAKERDNDSNDDDDDDDDDDDYDDDNDDDDDDDDNHDDDDDEGHGTINDHDATESKGEGG